MTAPNHKAPAKAGKGDARALRGTATRELLLETAERLISERGIDGVSMRQLGAAVGQANNSVIQYHFENREGLLREIVGRRARQLAPMRTAMLEQAKADGKEDDLATLLRILLVPIASFKDENGKHVYAGFMLHNLRQMWGVREGLGHAAWSQESAVKETLERLARMRPDLTPDQHSQRLLRLSRFFVTALVDWDRVREIGRPHDPEPYLLADLVNMMAAAFMAPLPDAPEGDAAAP